jgi:hypothetical protein
LAAVTKTGTNLAIDKDTTRKYRVILPNNPMLYKLLSTHIADFNNPHYTTAEQAGALVSVDDVKNPGGNVDLESDGTITIAPDDEENKITLTTSAQQVGAIVSVDGVENPGGDVDLESDGTITINPDDEENKITLTTSAEQVGAIVSVDGVKNPGGDVDLTSDGTIKIKPNDPDNKITLSLEKDSVKEKHIKGGAVTTDKIADNNVTEDKIANNAVTENKIKDGEVTEDKIGRSAVTRHKIGYGEVIEGKIGRSAVTEENIAEGAVTTEKIDSGAVDTNEIADGAVTGPKIARNAVDRDEIANGAVIGKKIDASMTFKSEDDSIKIKQAKGNDQIIDLTTSAQQVGAVAGINIEDNDAIVTPDSDGNIKLVEGERITIKPDNHSITISVTTGPAIETDLTTLEIDWHRKEIDLYSFMNDGLKVTFSNLLHSEMTPDIMKEIFVVTTKMKYELGHMVVVPIYIDGELYVDGDECTFKVTPEIKDDKKVPPEVLSDLLEKTLRLMILVQIKCDFIIDNNGKVVDGHHIGGTGKSGLIWDSDVDPPKYKGGIPGGVFESWFYLTPTQSDS